jgi:hypothetical protein
MNNNHQQNFDWLCRPIINEYLLPQDEEGFLFIVQLFLRAGLIFLYGIFMNYLIYLFYLRDIVHKNLC